MHMEDWNSCSELKHSLIFPSVHLLKEIAHLEIKQFGLDLLPDETSVGFIYIIPSNSWDFFEEVRLSILRSLSVVSGMRQAFHHTSELTYHLEVFISIL